MTTEYLISSILVMFAVTYGLRVVPIVFLRRKFKSRFMYSLLSYTPYGVLAAMILPNVFLCTATGAFPTPVQLVCAAIGFAAAFALAFFKKGLVAVSLGAIAALFAAQQLAELLFPGVI